MAYRYVDESKGLGGTLAWAYNFPVNSAHLRHEHKRWLDEVAVPFLKSAAGHTALLFGSASRSGDDPYNERLSLRRAEAAATYLKLKGVPAAQIEKVEAKGE